MVLLHCQAVQDITQQKFSEVSISAFFVRSHVTGRKKSLGTMTTSGFCPRSKSQGMGWLQEATDSSTISARSVQRGRVRAAMLVVSFPTEVFGK